MSAASALDAELAAVERYRSALRAALEARAELLAGHGRAPGEAAAAPGPTLRPAAASPAVRQRRGSAMAKKCEQCGKS